MSVCLVDLTPVRVVSRISRTNHGAKDKKSVESFARYLLDTNICSYIAKARENGNILNHRVQAHYRRHADRVFISAITVRELHDWIALPDTPDWQRENARALLAELAVRIVPFDTEAEALALKIADDLQKRGQKLEMADIQHAAVALRGGFVFVTHDRHFDRIMGLVHVDWVDLPVEDDSETP